jgi:Skp family chaperone for outer membrane proteins
MMKAIPAILLIALAAVACSTVPPVARIGEKSPQPVVIRYVNLPAVYETLKKKSDTARRIMADKEAVRKELDLAQEEILLSSGEKKAAVERMKALRLRYNAILEEEESFRAAILRRINQAVTEIASDTGIDFVLNIGDEVIYARGKYDITEDVIREILKAEKRSDPSVR